MERRNDAPPASTAPVPSGLGGSVIPPQAEAIILRNDATSSVTAIIFQVGVAVLKCWEMRRGQKVLIEKCGDVTVDGEQQIETKLYSGNLTDGHINFWKTISNWMQEGFDPEAFSALVLYTNQPIGPRALIAQWNDADTTRRLAILEEIRTRMVDQSTSRTDRPSQSITFQNAVLDILKRNKLLKVIERFHIEHATPDLPGTHALIKERFIKGIPSGNIDSYFRAVLGFVISPTLEGSSWEITFDSFSREIESLTSIFCKETRIFPRRYFSGATLPPGEVMEEHSEHRFVKELRLIEHHEVVPAAIRDYTSTLQTIKEEFSNYEVPRRKTEAYTQELLETFKARHRVACRNCTDSITHSQNFYDNFTSEPPHAFEGFESPPLAFRNGVLHSQMNDERLDLHWKVLKP